MPRPPAHTRDRMMDTAEALFARHGYGGVSVEDITSAVGVKKPDLYNHFRDKAELYVAVRLRRLRRLEGDLRRVLQADAPFPDRLPALFAVLLRHPQFLAALSRREVETFLPEKTRDFLFARAYGSVHEPLSRLLREAAARGEITLPESRIPFAYEALIALASHFAVEKAPLDPDTLARTAARLSAFFLHGLG